MCQDSSQKMALAVLIFSEGFWKKSAQGAGLTEQTGEKQCTRRFPRLKPRFVFKDCCYLLPTGRLAIVLLLLS